MELSEEALALANAILGAEATADYRPAVMRVDRIDEQRVELVVTLGSGPFLAIEWGERTSDRVPAYARGNHFIASYNRRPGAWDIESADTPPALRELTLRICKSLADAPAPCSLATTINTTVPTEPIPDDPEHITRLVEQVSSHLAAALESGSFPNPEGWRIDEARSFRYWRLVADIRLTNGEKNLGFLLFPTDPTESVYARTANHDIVYYSDDIAIAQHHDELYIRDHDTIDRFVTWFSQLDAAFAGQ